MNQIDESADGRRRLAIVQVEKLVDQVLPALVGVPQQAADHVVPQIRHLGAEAGAGGLHEDAAGVVGHEVADVRLDDAQVRAGQQVIAEVGVVVPDADVPAHAAPVGQVAAERDVELGARIVDRPHHAAFDAAKLYLHVGARLDRLGRLAGIPVGQRADLLVRVDLGHLVGHRVDEGQQRAHRRAFTFVDGRARLAAAVLGVVVLADREVLPFGPLADLLQDGLGDDPQDVRVGQAGLIVVAVVFDLGQALALEQAVVLRMLLAVFLGGDLAVETVVDVDHAGDPAQFAVRGDGIAAGPGGEGRITVGLAVVAPAES